MTGVRISQLASRSGVPATTLRYYEQVGLLPAERAPSGYRIYDERAIERLRFIRAAKRLTLSLDSIRTLLSAWEDEPCRTVKARLRPMVVARLQDADDGIAALTEMAGSLRAGLRRLDALPDRDHACDPSCAFLDDPDDAPVPPGAGMAGEVRRATANERAARPVACTLSTDNQHERLERWHALLAAARIEHTAAGAVADLPLTALAELSSLIVAEQECCPFFDFDLAFRGQRLGLSIVATDRALVANLLPEDSRL